jgi:hypothetical protein
MMFGYILRMMGLRLVLRLGYRRGGIQNGMGHCHLEMEDGVVRVLAKVKLATRLSILFWVVTTE